MTNELLERRVLELKERLDDMSELRERTQDTEEEVSAVVVYELVKLTPSDDLEAVKRTVNDIIDVLSRN